MFEFEKLCHEVEALTPAQRGVLLAEKALTVAAGLDELNITDARPIEVLASFIIGSVVSDGSISEKDYLGIYPALVKAFGEACDLAGIKNSFKVSKSVRDDINAYTQRMISIISQVDVDLANDIILLCLIITSADGKVSLRERRYVKKLCKA